MAERRKIKNSLYVDPLTELAIRHGTDKFGYHDYTPNYWQLFRDWRERPVKMLEIGVGGYADADRGGESLAMWRDFFTNGYITGIDIKKKTMDLGPRVQILQGSQIDAEFLAKLSDECGPFDIILDDGSHRNEHVIQSFELLFPRLNAPGIYIVEDTQTAFHARFGGSIAGHQPNSVAYFAQLFAQIDHVEMDAFHKTGLHPIASSVHSMQRFHNIVALHKADNTYPSNFQFNFDHPRVRETIQVFDQVIRDGASETGLLGYVKLLTRAGRVDDANAQVEKMIADKAASSAFYELAIGLRLVQGRLSEAAELAELAHEKYPLAPAFLVRLSIVQQRLGGLNAALATLEKAREIAPRDLTVQTRITQVHLAAGNLEAALAAVTRAIALRPKRGVTHYLKGRILASMGKKEGATAALRESLLLEPKFLQSRDLLDKIETDAVADALQTTEIVTFADDGEDS